jgi:hypothetical protein
LFVVFSDGNYTRGTTLTIGNCGKEDVEKDPSSLPSKNLPSKDLDKED